MASIFDDDVEDRKDAIDAIFGDDSDDDDEDDDKKVNKVKKVSGAGAGKSSVKALFGDDDDDDDDLFGKGSRGGIFEDDNDVSSLSSNKTLTRAAIRHPVPSTNKPQFIVEGSFMAATSIFNLPKIDDDDEEECSSSSSSNSSTASETYTFGRSYDDDGLITIQEDCSVSTWQQQWKQYSR